MFVFTAHKMEALVKLEAQYGQLPEFSPAIDDVLEYLKTVCSYIHNIPTLHIYRCIFHLQLLGLSGMRDIKMRYLLYFIISPEGSLPSQLVHKIS